MTTEQLHKAGLGREYWYQYINLNGFSSSPTKNGLKILSKNLDLNIKHLRQCINLYLSA